jgi:hypothetical protein
MENSCPAGTILMRLTASTSREVPFPSRFLATAGNTGNLLFETALERHLSGAGVVWKYQDLPQRIDCLVLALSNVLNPFCDLSDLTEAIEARHVRQVAVVGIGAQADDWNEKISLRPATERFLRIASERSVTIGARGDFTAELLHSWGVRNVDVIGCPSAFDAEAEKSPVTKPKLPWAPKVAIHATMTGVFRDKVSMLLANGHRHGADYIVQSEDWLISLLENPDLEHDDIEHLLYFAVPFMSYHVLRDWLARHGRVFFDADAFRAGMSGYNFVYGMRFHGNMAAIQAGIPALNLVFDTRTRELCEYLCLPTLDLSRFSSDVPLSELYDQADFALFNATYKLKRQRYISFLERQGLSHVLQAASETLVPGTNRPAALTDAVTMSSVSRVLSDAREADYRGDRLLHEIRARIAPFRSHAEAAAVQRAEFTPVL